MNVSFDIRCPWCTSDVRIVNQAQLEHEQKVIVECVGCGRENMVWVRQIGVRQPEVAHASRLKARARARLSVVR